MWNGTKHACIARIHTKLRASSYLHGNSIRRLVNFKSLKSQRVETTESHIYADPDLLRRFNDEVIKESERMGVCRSIKGVRTSRTRRRGSSPGELLTSEIEKKKEKKGEWEGGAAKGGKEGKEEEKKKKKWKKKEKTQAPRWKGGRLKVSRSLFKK